MSGELSCKNIIVILAGGIGERYDANKPKQFSMICGKELLAYSVEEMKKVQNAHKILIVLNNDKEEMERVKNTYKVEIIEGGKDRAHSFQNALTYIKKVYRRCEKVVFHEAARPLIKSKTIDHYFELLDEYDYIESCKKITDSLGSYVVKAPRREDYYLIQAPEAYRFSVVDQYFDCDSPIYFAANQFPEFIKGYQYFDIENNIKLTTPGDKAMIEYVIGQANRNSV